MTVLLSNISRNLKIWRNYYLRIKISDMNEENKAQEHCETGRLKVKVEYCGVCDYEGHCISLARRLSHTNPAVDVVCMRGRKGSFEVFVNEVQIYSKLQTTALPDFDEVIKHVKVASESGLIIPIVTNRCMECVMS